MIAKWTLFQRNVNLLSCLANNKEHLLCARLCFNLVINTNSLLQQYYEATIFISFCRCRSCGSKGLTFAQGHVSIIRYGRARRCDSRYSVSQLQQETASVSWRGCEGLIGLILMLYPFCLSHRAAVIYSQRGNSPILKVSYVKCWSQRSLFLHINKSTWNSWEVSGCNDSQTSYMSCF